MKSVFFLIGLLATVTGGAHAGGYVQLHGGVTQPTGDPIELGSPTFFGDLTSQRPAMEEEYGFTGGALLGAYVIPFVALEGEFTMRTEPLDEIAVDSVQSAVSEDLTTYAFMLNGVFRPSIPFLPSPYLGVGAGYLRPNGAAPNGVETAGQTAYQVKAGVGFGLIPGLGKIGLEASYLATDDLDFTAAEPGVAAETFSYGGLTGLLTYRLGF